MAALVRRKVLALVSELQVPLPNDKEINNGLKSAVVTLLTQAHCRPVPEPDEALSTPAKKKSRNSRGEGGNVGKQDHAGSLDTGE